MAALALIFLALIFVAIAGGTAGLMLALRRPGWSERWLGLVAARQSQRPGVLFFAASHGELLLLERVVSRLAELEPKVEPLILVPRPAIWQLARERFPHCRVHCITPIVPGTHARVLARLAPELLVIVEFARIPLWVRSAARHGVPVAIINGRISHKHQRACRRWPWLMRPLLGACNKIYAQTADDAEQFLRHGARANAIEITGPLKYDATPGRRNLVKGRELAGLAGIGANDVVLLAGSTTGDEEETLAGVFEQLAPEHPQLRLILVPRNLRRFSRVARMLRQRGLHFQRRTELESSDPDPTARVLLVDTLGELAAWWNVAHIGFVGASLVPRGGHNMIEPAARGVATCFGPHTGDFRDVVAALLGYDAAVQVSTAGDLQKFVRCCLIDPAYAAALGQRAQAVCRAHRGAIDRTCERLAALLGELGTPEILKLPAAKMPAIVTERRQAA